MKLVLLLLLVGCTNPSQPVLDDVDDVGAMLREQRAQLRELRQQEREMRRTQHHIQQRLRRLRDGLEIHRLLDQA